MKVFAVLFVCTLAVAVVKAHVTDEDKENFRVLAQRCKTESGANDNDIEGIVMHHMAASREAKCLRACLMKQVDLMNAEGKLVKELVMKVAEIRTRGDPRKMAITNEIAEICKDMPVSDDHCEAAEQYGVCFLEESKKRNIVPADF